jgi:molybdate transport system ATP-binding protein
VEGAVTNAGLHARLVVRRADGFLLDIALSIAPGQTVALLGPNGAGKSTAVAAMAGLLPVDSGRIVLGQTVLDDPDAGVLLAPEERRIGVVFQDYLLFPHLTALENVAFGLRSRGAGHEDAHGRARELLHRLGLAGVEGHKPDGLSGGQAQRVALARALVTDPDLLLLDEPLAALDVTTRTELRHVLGEELAVFSGPRLLITHDPTEAFLLADRIHIIEDGVVTQAGSADDIRLRPRTPYAADLAGLNLFAGHSAEGAVTVGSHSIHIADELADGPVLLTIHPTAVSVHSHRPDGSPRNTWPTTVDRVESLGSRVRIRTGPPLPLTVEVTAAAREELSLEPRTEVWVAIKATEIGVQSDIDARGRGRRQESL